MSPTDTATDAWPCSTRKANSCANGAGRPREAEIETGEGGVFAQVVHCITMSKAGLIYVCDRQGNRVQVFQKSGKFVRNIWIPTGTPKLPDKRGTAWWVAFSPDPEQKFMYVMNGRNEQVHILDHASGKILSSFGRPGHQIGNFTHGHTLAVDSKGSIYVAETDWGRRIQKFKIVGWSVRGLFAVADLSDQDAGEPTGSEISRSFSRCGFGFDLPAKDPRPRQSAH